MSKREKPKAAGRAGLSYSGQMLRQGDSDRYLMSLFAEPRSRKFIWALFALNLELARTREVVSDRTLGLIRLQWWREAIESIHAGRPVRGNAAVDDLAEAISSCHLPLNGFEVMIAARERDLEDGVFNGIDSLLAYIDETNVPLMRMANRVNGGREDNITVDAVSRAYAVSGILRSIPWDRDRFAEMPEKAMRQTVGKLVEKAELYLSAKPVTALFKAEAALARLNIKRLAQLDYEVLDASLLKPLPFKALRLWWAVHNS